jgi:hypothetical protein
LVTHRRDVSAVITVEPVECLSNAFFFNSSLDLDRSSKEFFRDNENIKEYMGAFQVPPLLTGVHDMAIGVDINTQKDLFELFIRKVALLQCHFKP